MQLGHSGERVLTQKVWWATAFPPRPVMDIAFLPALAGVYQGQEYCHLLALPVLPLIQVLSFTVARLPDGPTRRSGATRLTRGEDRG